MWIRTATNSQQIYRLTINIKIEYLNYSFLIIKYYLANILFYGVLIGTLSSSSSLLLLIFSSFSMMELIFRTMLKLTIKYVTEKRFAQKQTSLNSMKNFTICSNRKMITTRSQGNRKLALCWKNMQSSTDCLRNEVKSYLGNSHH